MQAAQLYAEVATVAQQNGTWRSWTAQLKKQLIESPWPSILVVVDWEKRGQCEWPELCNGRCKKCISVKRGERIMATNKDWLELCEFREDQVVGKKFSDVRGFQGPLTTEACKLHLSSLLVTERPSAKGLQVVNYTGQTKKPLILQVNVDILRWHGQNMVFLCTIVGYKDALHVERPIAGSGRQAVVGIMAARAAGTSVNLGGANSDFSIPLFQTEGFEEPVEGELPLLWKCLLDSRSELQSGVHETSPEESGDEKATCAVCCEDLEGGDEIRILSCSHRLHTSCVDKWFAHQLGDAAKKISIAPPSSVWSAFSCPVCKQDPLRMSEADLEGLAGPACRPVTPLDRRKGKFFARRWLPSFLSTHSKDLPQIF